MKSKMYLCLLMLGMLAAACSASPAEKEAAAAVSAQKTLRAELGPTAVFQTAVSARLTEDAPPPTETPSATPPASATPTPTATPQSTSTPDAAETPEIAPTNKNPWNLQAECDTNQLCSRIEITNKTPGWFQITLDNIETGETGFFSTRSGGNATIRMSRGEYWMRMTWYCGGETFSWRRILTRNQDYEVLVKCPSKISVHEIP